MRSRNNNFKVKGAAQNVLRGLGISSTGILVLLGILAISPITNKADAANGWDEELKNYRESASTVTLSMDSGTNSVVNAGNTNTNVGVVKRTASVTLGNTNGYSVYIRANSANLTGSSSSNTIPSVTSNSTLSQMTDKWGWNGSVGDSVTDCSLSDVFKQMTTTNQTLGSGGAVSSGTEKVTMCFGTRVSEAKVADTYSNTVTLSVVAQPGRTATFNGITTMQQMTPSICSAANYHETAQLTDTRDNKKYWVTKMLDGNCWMSQNLDFNISTSNVTTATSDVTSNWTSSSTYPPQTTYNNADGGIGTGSQANTATYSWDLGEYVIEDPTATTACPGSPTSLSDCSDQGFVKVATADGWVMSSDPNFYLKTNYTSADGQTSCTKAANTAVNVDAPAACKIYDGHFMPGNYYQWNTATAGTGGTIVNVVASGSICPKNWRLPSSENNTENGTLGYMLLQYGLANANGGYHYSLTGTSPINSSTYNFSLSPLFLVKSGTINTLYHTISSAGREANYWSSKAYSKESSAYSLSLPNLAIAPSYYNSRSDPYSLRCLVQTP